MNAIGSSLKELHQLHTKLREAQEKLDRGPKQLTARNQLIEKKKADLDAKRQRLKQLRMGADQKSLQLKTNEAKIGELRTKLNQASTNREYDIIRHQIDADTMANSVLEDEILEALEKVDQAQIEIKQAEADIAATEKDRDRFAADFKAVEGDLQRQATELIAAIRQVERILPGDVAPTYQKLVQVHGAKAMAPVEGRACTNCYVGLTSQNYVELKSGKPLFCKSCGVLLYLPEE